MIDVVVVGGYLGAGKTSLVNHLLREGTGRRTLVLVNDFGKVAVADELVASRDGEMLTLVNGCVCCSLASPLIDTLIELRRRPDPPELLVIEASGVADAEALSHHAMIPGYRLNGIVVVVDAETITSRAEHALVGRTVLRQLTAAGLVVLNKTDLVSNARRDQLREWLAARAPNAEVVDAVEGRVPVEFVVGPSTVAVEHHHEPEPHEDPHLTATWFPGGLVDRAGLTAWFERPGSGVVRAKGVVRFSDRGDRREMVQVVGRRCNITVVGAAAVSDAPVDALVLIGLPPEFDGPAAVASLDAAANP